MRQWTAAIVLCLCAGALVADSGPSRTFERSVPVPAGSDLEVSLKVGEMEVETAAVEEVRVEVTATCKPESLEKCEERLERLEVESTTDHTGTAIEVAGVSKRYSKMLVKARFIVPESSPLSVRMYAGELRVDGGGQDMAVKLKFGEVTVHQPEARTQSVLVDANFGDARIFANSGDPDPRRPFLVGSKVSWDQGQGSANIAVKLSAGDIAVHLD